VQTPAAEFLASLEVDRALLPFDLAGSIAHAEMLGRTGIVSPADATTLVRGLRSIHREAQAGRFPWRPELEDVHTNVEVRLTELVGPVGGALHTGRSRNDQIALDERLYLRAAIHDVVEAILALQATLVARAETEAGVPMPGYTHLQRAQPVSVGHHLLAHVERLDRDVDRLLATAHRANVSPLGAGALAGSTLPLDPAGVAQRLGFDRAFGNSLDAVSDRDPLAELLFDLALLGVHLSGLGEEIVLFATPEFGFLERGPALGSGSSLMPQKRNPDVAELARAKAGRTIGDLVALLTVLKGLPLAYDRDLQEDKAPVLDAVRTATQVVHALTRLWQSAAFDHARLAVAAADPELYATDLAEHLVRRGVPFREAHEQTARHFRASTDPSSATGDAAPAIDPNGALARRVSPGGPGPASVAGQLALARARLASRRESLSSLGRQVELVEELLNEEPQ
jgi:argininosuccinate lyase